LCFVSFVQGTDWGEQGYFLVAQEGGGDWGLFGILGEAVIPLKAENVTGQVAEPSSGGAPSSLFVARPMWCLLSVLGLGTAMLAISWSV
jgi:hypothetical protein